MSTATPPKPPPPAPAATRPQEMRVYGHSSLLYWWPVWLVGYIMGFITLADGTRLAIVPEDSQYFNDATILNAQPPGTTSERTDFKDARNVVVLPKDGKIQSREDIKERISANKNLGVIFTVVLFLVIIITNIPLRGLSSALALVTILFITVLFAFLDWWEPILSAFGRLTIYMNAGFYIFIATVLLIVWALVTFGFDRLNYWRVTPGQITHEYVFGGGERSYSTDGMTFEKLRSDLFRHWVLGFGSGDMVMHPLASSSGVGAREELQVLNVLFVGTKLQRIQEMIAERPA